MGNSGEFEPTLEIFKELVNIFARYSFSRPNSFTSSALSFRSSAKQAETWNEIDSIEEEPLIGARQPNTFGLL